MESIKKPAACLAMSLVLCGLSVKCFAFDPPPHLEIKRGQLFEMMQFTPAFRDHGIAGALALQGAKENLRRFGVLNRCSPAFTPGAGLLSGRYRSAVEQTAARTQALLLGVNQENFSYLMGAPMWAFDQLSEQEVDRFLAIKADGEATQAFAGLAKMTFLLQFHRISYDLEAGGAEPASVIWLKNYFRREGALDRLQLLVDKFVPEASENFRKTGDFSDHTPADAGWLRALAIQIRLASPLLAEQLSAQENLETQLLMTLIQSQRPYRLLNSAELHEALDMKSQLREAAALLLLRPDPLSPLDSAAAQRAAAAVAQAYPEAPDFFSRVIESLGPKQMVGKLAYELCEKVPVR